MLRVDNISVSIHPPRVGRDRIKNYCNPDMLDFNPPSPCGEGLPFDPSTKLELPEFQSTLPVWGGTTVHTTSLLPGYISIHPPRVGRDAKARRSLSRVSYFNPPSPCGEGPSLHAVDVTGCLFQSTLPVWGGTRCARSGT